MTLPSKGKVFTEGGKEIGDVVSMETPEVKTTPNRIIFKYPFDVYREKTTVRVPKGSRPLMFAAQRDIPTLWVEQDDILQLAEADDWIVTRRATGESWPPFPSIGTYLGTAFIGANQELVFHYYLRQNVTDFDEIEHHPV